MKLVHFLSLIALSLLGLNINAQTYPARLVTVTLPYSPGSTSVVAGLVSEETAARLKQPFIVVPKPGADGLIGVRAVKAAPADGYNILFAISSLFSSHLARGDAGYQPSDFVPVAVVASSPYFLATSSAVPSKTVKELVDYSKANPGKLFFGSLGPLTNQALLPLRMVELMGMNWSEIPYKGGADALQAVIGNSVQGYFITNNLALTVLKNPRVNIIASTGAKRSPTLPDTPTFVELGYPDLREETIWAMYARSDTPPLIIAKLRTEFSEALKQLTVIEKLKAVSMEPYDRSIDQFIKDSEVSAVRYAAAVKKVALMPK